MKKTVIYYLSSEHTPNLEYDTPTSFSTEIDKLIDGLANRNKAILEHPDAEKYSIFDFVQAFNNEEILDQGWIAFNEEEIEDDTYTVVTWPDSQEFMEEPWFEEEAILDVEAHFGSSAYFIPTKYLKQ